MYLDLETHNSTELEFAQLCKNFVLQNFVLQNYADSLGELCVRGSLIWESLGKHNLLGELRGNTFPRVPMVNLLSEQSCH